MKKYRNLIIFLGFFGLHLLAGMLVLSEVIGSTGSMIISSVGGILLAWFLYQEFLKQKWHELMAQTTIKHLIKLSLLFFLINIIIRWVVLVILEPYLDFDTLARNQQALEQLQEIINPLLFTFATAISAPIVEELVFREALNGWVDPNKKRFVYLMWFVSTYLFAVAHVKSMQDFLIYLPLSISLLWFYVKFNRNVCASIFFHFVNNAIAVVLMFLTQLIHKN